ncbi:preprotein translocase subunit SecY [Candidatus Woesearchaeota archaeon]|nr:preprotein translocase subunit SecY [Candidatus Woesearchaeota archaeon]
MVWYRTILDNLPEVAAPTQRRLAFKEKLKWTLIVLVLFYVLGFIPLFGLGQNALQQFEFLSIILGAEFGSIISLGIGPIVTASIVLQLLNGSGIIKFDLTSHEGKKNFQGIQKMLSIFFIIFEAIIYVKMGGLAPVAGLGASVLIFQLFLGGLIIMFMDEVVSKWGFGSGLSLFIAAGVSKSLFVRMFSPLRGAGGVAGEGYSYGAIPALFQSLAAGDPKTAGLMIAGLLSTIIVFMIVVFAQSIRVEIPLSFGRVRGHGIRWPLNFFYTSNIPVILVAALMANVQLWGRLMQNWVGNSTGVLAFISKNIVGQFIGNSPSSGLVLLLSIPRSLEKLITGSFQVFPAGQGFWYGLMHSDLFHAIVFVGFMMVGSLIFSVFWVQTSGMDAKSQAKQIMASGLQIPGFRKDERILERLLERYIWPLTVMGGLAVGALAALADLTGALTSGTGLLLTVMIVYKLYEEVAQQHMMDMNPMIRKFIGK